MAYRIIIEKIETVDVEKESWQKLFDVDEQTQRSYYNSREDGAIKNYGYVKNTVASEVETKVFEQTVDKMNIKKVIKAVNDMYEPEDIDTAGGAGGRGSV